MSQFDDGINILRNNLKVIEKEGAGTISAAMLAANIRGCIGVLEAAEKITHPDLALKFINDMDQYLRSGDGDWDISAHPDPEVEEALKIIRNLFATLPKKATD